MISTKFIIIEKDTLKWSTLNFSVFFYHYHYYYYYYYYYYLQSELLILTTILSNQLYKATLNFSGVLWYYIIILIIQLRIENQYANSEYPEQNPIKHPYCLLISHKREPMPV